MILAERPSVRKIINTKSAPAPIGPYNQAVQINEYLYVSGSIGIDPSTGVLVPGGVLNETYQSLKNIGAILDAANCNFTHVVRTTIMLANISDFARVNQIYENFFIEKYPARAVYQAASLVKNAQVEIEAIAVVGDIIDVN